MKREYEEEVKILEAAMELGASQVKITPEDIEQLEQDLKTLPLMGQRFQEILQDVTGSDPNVIIAPHRPADHPFSTRNSRDR